MDVPTEGGAECSARAERQQRGGYQRKFGHYPQGIRDKHANLTQSWSDPEIYSFLLVSQRLLGGPDCSTVELVQAMPGDVHSIVLRNVPSGTLTKLRNQRSICRYGRNRVSKL